MNLDISSESSSDYSPEITRFICHEIKGKVKIVTHSSRDWCFEGSDVYDYIQVFN